MKRSEPGSDRMDGGAPGSMVGNGPPDARKVLPAMTDEPIERGPGVFDALLPAGAAKRPDDPVDRSRDDGRRRLGAVRDHVSARLEGGGGRHAGPRWAVSGGSDAARQVLIGIAAAVSPWRAWSSRSRSLRCSSRRSSSDRGCCGTSSGTSAPRSAWAVRRDVRVLGADAGLRRASIRDGFVPHISVTVAWSSCWGIWASLIYFIHHVAKSIQLTTVVVGHRPRLPLDDP